MNTLLCALLLVASPDVPVQYLGTVRPKDNPKRVVTVAPSLTELLHALGLFDRVVGVSRFDDFPPEVQKLPKVGGFLDPSLEAIVALSPDLVIAVPSAGNRGILERVAKLGHPVLVVPGNTYDDVFHAIRGVSEAFGPKTKAKGRALIQKIKGTQARLSKRVAGQPKVKVAVVYGWNPLILGGPGSFVDTMIGQLGGENIVRSGPQYPQYSTEQLLFAAPEVIIDATEGHGGRAPYKRWSSVPAVKNKRVHQISLSGVLRPGPRIIDGMKSLAALLHPALF